MIAVWIINEWTASGSPSQIQMVELGPGRGTLMDDIMRTFQSLNKSLTGTSISIHFVEISPYLSELQHKNLSDIKLVKYTHNINKNGCTQQGKSKYGHQMFWYKHIEDVPKDAFTFFVGHEFFDALPIHKFVKENNVWKEVYVDLCPESEDTKFRFVLMPHSTPASQTLIKACFCITFLLHIYVCFHSVLQSNENRNHVEISPKAGIIIQEIARRIFDTGGAALIADYGHFGTKEDTLRVEYNLSHYQFYLSSLSTLRNAKKHNLISKTSLFGINYIGLYHGFFQGFKSHQLVDVLTNIGESDITADVDFKYLKEVAEGFGVSTKGPISQQSFLKNMGIDVRIMVSSCKNVFLWF